MLGSHVAIVSDGIWLSEDYGLNWVYSTAPDFHWLILMHNINNILWPTDITLRTSITVSSSGQYLYATVFNNCNGKQLSYYYYSGGCVYISTDYGSSWNEVLVSSGKE